MLEETLVRFSIYFKASVISIFVKTKQIRQNSYVCTDDKIIYLHYKQLKTFELQAW